jgi:hypothetical protein
VTIQYQYTFDDYREALEEARKLQRAVAQKQKAAKNSTTMTVSTLLTIAFLVIIRMVWPNAVNLALPHAMFDIGIFTLAVMVLTAFSTLHNRQNRTSDGRAWRTSLIFFVATALVMAVTAVLMQTKSSPSIEDFILPHIGLILLSGFFVIALYKSVSTGARRTWDQNVWLQLPKTTDISVDGVTQSDSTVRSTWQWSGFVRAKESKNLFIFFIGPANFIMLPKRAFETEEQLNAMRAMMRLGDGTRTGGFPVNLPTDRADKSA